jgi:hypothetical protein
LIVSVFATFGFQTAYADEATEVFVRPFNANELEVLQAETLSEHPGATAYRDEKLNEWEASLILFADAAPGTAKGVYLSAGPKSRWTGFRIDFESTLGSDGSFKIKMVKGKNSELQTTTYKFKFKKPGTYRFDFTGNEWGPWKIHAEKP